MTLLQLPSTVLYRLRSGQITGSGLAHSLLLNTVVTLLSTNIIASVSFVTFNVSLEHGSAAMGNQKMKS
jgi:hypothetical protein